MISRASSSVYSSGDAVCLFEFFFARFSAVISASQPRFNKEAPVISGPWTKAHPWYTHRVCVRNGQILLIRNAVFNAGLRQLEQISVGILELNSTKLLQGHIVGCPVAPPVRCRDGQESRPLPPKHTAYRWWYWSCRMHCPRSLSAEQKTGEWHRSSPPGKIRNTTMPPRKR